MEIASLLSLTAFIALNFAAASSGAIFRPGQWYESLRKPSWNPPNWAFPVVWSLLFCTNIYAGWLVWETAGAAAWPALVVYVISLVLNATWSGLFFGLRRMDWALAEVGVFWLSLVGVIALFAPISLTAALVLIPYLVWVTVAAFLNLRLIQLNAPQTQFAE